MCEVFERRFSLINSSHRYSTQPNYRSTPNYPTKTKARVPLSLFVALRLFSRADSRSGVHITRFSQKNKMCGISTIWRKMCGISFFLFALLARYIGTSSKHLTFQSEYISQVSLLWLLQYSGYYAVIVVAGLARESLSSLLYFSRSLSPLETCIQLGESVAFHDKRFVKYALQRYL